MIREPDPASILLRILYQHHATEQTPFSETALANISGLDEITFGLTIADLVQAGSVQMQADTADHVYLTAQGQADCSNLDLL